MGVDCAIVNAFRRILLAEVPTMAIEKVAIRNNTSIIQDEILAHRLGLLPVRADPRLFTESGADFDPLKEPHDTRAVLIFDMNVTCTRQKGPPDEQTGEPRVTNASVYSRSLIWRPIGNQKPAAGASKRKSQGDFELDVGMVHDDILIAKLRPSQTIDLTCYVVKGTGKQHTKWSPCMCTYRLMPYLELTKSVSGELADRLRSCFADGVIRVVEGGGSRNAEVNQERVRADTCSREVFRHADLKDAVRYGRRRDHFIFTIESFGALPPADLFVQAIAILKGKCQSFLQELDTLANE